MKLRTRSNSIRLRLTRGEVSCLASTGSVEESIFVGPSEADVLTHTLRTSADATRLSARLEGRTLVVTVPLAEARAWAESEAVSLTAEQPALGDRTLTILVEKDFACLTKRNEDDSDAFPNPNETCR